MVSACESWKKYRSRSGLGSVCTGIGVSHLQLGVVGLGADLRLKDGRAVVGIVTQGMG